ncbi:MAG: GNAT family N-acetyltransferase [Candidatus Omnitrophota bacterium]
MFHIRRILDTSTTANKNLIAQVQTIMRSQFSFLNEKELQILPDKIDNPLKYQYQTRLFIAERGQGAILGFALLLYIPDVNFCFLDFMAAGVAQTNRGVGGALYERIREEAKRLDVKALLFECLPDDPALAPKKEDQKKHARTLAFYEKFGVYPVLGSAYETPLKKGGNNPPYLMLDLLGNEFPDTAFFKAAVRAILGRNYSFLCSEEYIRTILRSFDGANIYLRPAKYQKKVAPEINESLTPKEKIIYIANEGHEIHHIHDRGYVESPVRLKVIIRELEKLDFMVKKSSLVYPDKVLQTVHDKDYLAFLKKACESIPNNKSIYPYIFPIRNKSRKPVEMPVRAGYYCIDTFTPLNTNAYLAARSGVNCVLSAAEEILGGKRFAYALVRPPGHHAERNSFGGFCYFANSALAAHKLSEYGKVAILDVDYHHGNSQQDIFYTRKDVFTVSLHGDPKYSYPYFTGFADEQGEGEGKGFNVNIPLPEALTPEQYFIHLGKALTLIKKYDPTYLIVALGLDTAKDDPTGTWALRKDDFKKLGSMIAGSNLPTLIVQEGGYRTKTLGTNARNFFVGLYHLSKINV